MKHPLHSTTNRLAGMQEGMDLMQSGEEACYKMPDPKHHVRARIHPLADDSWA